MKKVFDKKSYYDDTFVIQEISPSELSKKTVSNKKKQNKKITKKRNKKVNKKLNKNYLYHSKDSRRQSTSVQSVSMSTNSELTKEEAWLPKDNYDPYIPDYSDREFVPREKGTKKVTAEEINQRWADKHPDQVADGPLYSSDASIYVQTKAHKTPTVASKKKLHIFTSFSLISCNTQKHKIIEASIPLFSIIEMHHIDVPVHKCLTCKRTFISEEMWRAYMKHGIDKAYYVQHETMYDQFNKHSELNSYGYAVGKTGLSVVERQALLMNLLKQNKMKAYEIERDIVNAINIHQNNPKMQDAVSDWEDDLKFLGDYTLKNLRKR